MTSDHLRVTWLVNGRTKTRILCDPLVIWPNIHVKMAVSKGRQFTTFVSSDTK